MNIKHHPYFDITYIEEHYSKKDGVPIKYVCTSALGYESYAGDIFYRDTPHPEFGNRYFQIVGQAMTGPLIRSADIIEERSFTMLDTPEGLSYSQHTNNYVNAGHWAIDGGRAYVRLIGNNPKTKIFVVKGGGFVDVHG